MLSSRCRALLWLGALLLAGCDERVSVGLQHGGADAGVGAVIPWGTWAAALPVPQCPPGALLTVDTVDDELEGGSTVSDPSHLSDPSQAGPRLSLEEALWIAQNRPGPDTILFDPAVFPVEAPATIAIQGLYLLPGDLADACIDARNRGVIVYWAQSARSAGTTAEDLTHIWGVGAGSLQIGLELYGLEEGLGVTTGGQVAGCRFLSEPDDVVHPSGSVLVRLYGGTLGPGNVLLGPDYGVLTNGGAVSANRLGYDPRTGQEVAPSYGVNAAGFALDVQDNVFSVRAVAVLAAGISLSFRGNAVGVAPDDGHPLTEPVLGVDVIGNPATGVVGPGNAIHASSAGVSISTNGFVTVTRSEIIALQGILYTASTQEPFAPPVITSAASSEVTGTCLTAGHVELFSGTAGTAEQYLGAADCAAAGGWTVSASVSSGVDLVATLTDVRGYTSVFSGPFRVP